MITLIDISQDEENLYNTIFGINKRLEIIIDNSTKYHGVINSNADNTIGITTFEAYHELGIEEGDIIDYYLGTEDSSSNNFYFCSSRVKRIDQTPNNTNIGISYPHKIESLGDRKFFRLPLTMTINYKLLNVIDHYEGPEALPFVCFQKMGESLTTDLSGNGMKIILNEHCRKEQEVSIILPDIDNMKLLGRIVWIEPNRLNHQTLVAITFKNIQPQQQDKIISHMYSVMRRKKQNIL